MSVCHLFKWLGLSVRKSYHPFEQLGLSVQRNLLSIRMAWAIRSKKKLCTIRATEAICSKINFSQVSISRQFRHQPLMSRYKVCLQMHHEQSRTSSPLEPSSLSYVDYHLIIGNRHTFYSILKFFFNKFPRNNVLTFHRCMQISNDLRSKDMIPPRMLFLARKKKFCASLLPSF